MNKIVYYVAVSLDGFICGKEGDISQFAQAGNGVKKYLEDLKAFNTVLMGRHTYEFGYLFGLQPGDPAYPHMEHYIFSDTLFFKKKHPKVHVEHCSIKKIKEIRKLSKSDIYLCGGGSFAGWMLDQGEIDILKLKINPIVLGSGIKLFGNSKTKCNLKLMDSVLYEEGLQIASYKIIRSQ